MAIFSIAEMRRREGEYLREGPQEQAPPIRMRDLRGQGAGRQLQEVGRRLLAST